MIVNRYRANNLKSAIEKATAEMGPDAKILHVRKLGDCISENRRYNNPNELIEIVAVVDEDIETDNVNKKKYMTDDTDKKTPSINLLVDDLDNIDNLEDDRHSSGNNPPKNPKTLSEVLKAYSGKTYQNNNEKSSSVFVDSDRIIDKRQKQADITNIAKAKENEQKKRNIYPENQKTTYTSIDKDISQTTKRAKGYEKISDARQYTRVSKSKISQLLHECLVKNQVNNDLVYEILSILNKEDDKFDYESKSSGVREYLLDYLSDQLIISKEIDNSKKVIILIGPTGVGKTTTLAKLAAQYHFQKERNVGLITIDAYRIAAVDQLKTYAQIMSIPLKVALTPEQLWKCIDDYNSMDVILVDTPGRSHLNMRELRAIEDFLEAAQPADTHLLISASTKDNDAYNVVETFAPNYVKKYIFTKLDETSSFGLILNICSRLKKPISYFTIGQNVPEDIRLADIEFLTDMFVSRKQSIR